MHSAGKAVGAIVVACIVEGIDPVCFLVRNTVVDTTIEY
jgi:hypothetical protein